VGKETFLICNEVASCNAKAESHLVFGWPGHKAAMTMLASLFAFSARWRDEIYNRLLLRKMPLVILFIISQRWVG